MVTCPRLATLGLEPYFNNDGISTDDDRTDGDFTGAGVTYPAEDLPPSNALVDYGGVVFRFPDKRDGLDNNISLEGQTVPVGPDFYSALHVLGSAEDSLEDVVGFVTESRGSPESPLALSAWHRGRGLQYGERLAIPCSGYHHPSGHVRTSHLGVCYGIWMQTVQIRASFRLVALQLPDNPGMHLFAMTLTRDPAGGTRGDR